MRRVWTALSRLVDPLRRQPRDRRLDDEVRDHLERLTADYAACGLAPAEAALAARRAFGGVDQTKARYREQRGWPWLDALLQDLRFACRRVVRDPVFSATVVAVLAIGLGVGHLFFTLTYAHLVRGLPIAEADRVVAVSTVDARGADRGLSAGDLADLRQAQRTFEDLAAYTTTAVTLGDDDGAAERVDATALSASAFAMTGVAALAGRTITTGDETPGTPPAVVLTERLWRSRYQRDAAVIGRHVKVDGAPATVVGVVSDRSGLPSAAAMFLPLATQPPASAGRDVRTLRVFGRLAPGAGLADAAADLDAIAADLARRFPATNAGTRLRLEPLNERLLGGAAARRGWRPFIVAGLVVIVVAATNAGNLLLVGAAARAREVALRTSLGASRGRILRQLLAESVVLAGLAAILGLIVSRAGVGLYRQRIPDGILPYWFDYSLNGALFAGLSVMTLAAVAVFAVWPALHASRTAVVAVLQDGGRSDTGRLAPRLGGAVLLAVQLGLATVLVAQTGVAALTGEESLPTDARLHDARVLTGAITLPASYGTLEARRAFQEQIVDRLRALPGVRGVALAASLPLDGAAERRLVVAGHERDDAVGEATVHVADVGAGYFAVLELPIVAGRDFVATDGTSADSAGDRQRQSRPPPPRRGHAARRAARVAPARRSRPRDAPLAHGHRRRAGGPAANRAARGGTDRLPAAARLGAGDGDAAGAW